MEAVPAAVWITRDPDAEHVTGSRFGYELLDVKWDANLSKTAAEGSGVEHVAFFHEGQQVAPDRLPLQVASRSGEEVRECELECRFSDGRGSLFLFGSAVPLRDREGQPRGAIAAFVDITRLKRAAAALREADRRKNEFLALLSHELRNPLAPIRTAVHLMKLRGDVPSRNEREVIERQAQHLVRLVDDLLDVSRVARGKVELRKQRVELASVVAKAIETTSSLFEQKQHALSVDVAERGLLLHADEARLVQVVCNLLTNAARYRAPRGRVSLTARREAELIVLSVRDDGSGIAPELLPHVFELFVQGPDSEAARRASAHAVCALGLWADTRQAAERGERLRASHGQADRTRYAAFGRAWSRAARERAK